MTKQLKIQQLINETQRLTNEVYRFFRTTNNTLQNQIPRKALDEKKKIRIVVAGQYSAGKSSIIRALTGNNRIKIGVGITTDVPKTYHWGDIEITDTPGIHTNIRPKHDERSNVQIKKADLLIFVITNELFDNALADHFKKLVRVKAKGIMLVVNKMGRISGERKATEEIIKKNIQTILSPLTPEELRITFIDAEEIIDANEMYQEREIDKAEYRESQKESGFESFIRNLEAFSREAGFAGRLTSTLNQLEGILKEAELSKSSNLNNSEKDLIKMLFLKQRRLLTEALEGQHKIDFQISELTRKIYRMGIEFTELIGDTSEEELKSEFNSLNKEIEIMVKRTDNDISENISFLNNSFKKKEQALLRNPLIQRSLSTQRENTSSYQGYSSSRDEYSMNYGSLSRRNTSQKLLKNVGNIMSSGLIKGSIRSGFKIGGITNHFGSTIYKGLRTLNINPFKALKMTRTFGKFGKMFGPIVMTISVIMDLQNKKEAEKREKALVEARANFRRYFHELEEKIETYFKGAISVYFEETLNKTLGELDSQFDEILNAAPSSDPESQEIKAYFQRTNALLKRIHREM